MPAANDLSIDRAIMTLPEGVAIKASSAIWHKKKTLLKLFCGGLMAILHLKMHSSSSVGVEGTSVERPFYVLSDQCSIPYVDPFTPELLEIFKPVPYQNCTTEEDLVTTTYDLNRRRYVLHIDAVVGRRLLAAKDDSFTCCYMQIIRVEGNDRRFKLKPCVNFLEGFVVPRDVDGMLVRCSSVAKRRILQEDAFAFIQDRNETQSNGHTGTGNGERKPNVLIVGIDSMSRINVRRNLPATVEYLMQNDWYEMEGYNKVGDNTFPNVMAFMAGFDESAAYDICSPATVGGLDSCPILWKEFKKRGYLTAYAEDETRLNTFNYLKKGFEHPPVDYYLRPFMMAIENHLKKEKYHAMRYCIGRRHTASYIYDYCSQFASRFYEQQPVFGLFWMNDFSHSSFDSAASMDVKMLQMMRDFESFEIFNTSIVVFLSDHGMRYGSLHNLVSGFLEERLPMLFIWLPPWFREKYPLYARSLRENRNRLSSPYDLHMTLKHLLELTRDDDLELPPTVGCPKCQSLLLPLPESRSCDDAGISEHYCTCTPFKTVTDKKLTHRIAELIVDKMNEYLVDRKLTDLCRKIELFTGLSVLMKKIVLDELLHEVDNVADETYRIKYVTKPNEAVFQATLIYRSATDSIEVDVESISRLDSYVSHSKCVNDKQAKKYCFCHAS